MNEPSIHSVEAFLSSVEIDPIDEFGLESMTAAAGPPQPDFTNETEQSILVGSQVAGFSSDVPIELRPVLTNVFLLAQLVADKKTNSCGGTEDWHKHYFDTLSNVGWRKIAHSNVEQVVSGTALEVHREIIPIITAAFGPAVTAASTIIRILKGLDDMDKDMPWITLFNSKSRRATSNPFQFSQTIMEGGVPKIVLLAFELNAARSVTQILFFKFSSDE
ncbi:MAG: hypothetical protein AAFW66_06545, partial [Pseudomonadota bacterium]